MRPRLDDVLFLVSERDVDGDLKSRGQTNPLLKAIGNSDHSITGNKKLESRSLEAVLQEFDESLVQLRSMDSLLEDKPWETSQATLASTKHTDLLLYLRCTVCSFNVVSTADLTLQPTG